MTNQTEDMMANAIRALTMDAVQAANSGHPGAPMGMADVAAVLFNRFANVDPSHDQWADRDRFVMSAGHGSMLVYAVNHLLGYDDMDMDQIRNFRQMGYRTAGHPEFGHAKGIECTTGPLGQGISMAVGMALAERMQNARFGDDLVDHYTYVIAGDGCLMEGISHEAIDFAGHLGLGKLIVMWDDNKITIDGSTDVSTSMDQQARFLAAGWHVQSIDGHDKDMIGAAIEAARNSDKPSLIACRTIIGFGAPNKQGTSATHGAPLGADEIAAAREVLGWPHAPFEIPQEIYDAWHIAANRGRTGQNAWAVRLENNAQKDAFTASVGAPDTTAVTAAMTAYRKRLSEDAPKVATRKASEMALEVINATLPNSIGGSADLTGSNLTRTKGMESVTRDNYAGDFVNYGVREHVMAAIMNGMSLHGGFKPYSGTFLAFADYCRPAIRLSSLMQQPVVHVMTHDSIGLGEDGPTHQPVEHVASLRAIPNLMVFRPADVVETAEAWEISMNSTTTPSVLALSRQGLPCVRTTHTDMNMSSKGAYVLREAAGARDVTLIATGSEVEIALNAADQLVANGIKAAVVSAPCFELFAGQDAAYRAAVLGTAPRVGVEAAIEQSWGKFLGDNSAFVGMTGFGASAPANELYEHFGITPEAVAKAAQSLIS
ncbi:MAG: transketolase [Rhodobacteraceae bacterium]|nr:transketolase [Paracoccaceae bacterium]